MKFKPQDLLTLLIGLFLLSSCKDSNTIGLDLDTDSKIEGTLVDTLTINSRTEKENKVQTFRIQRHPIGYLSDPTFGTLESSIVATFTTPTDILEDYTFTNTATLDSAVLVLSYAKELYADTVFSRYNFEVRELANNMYAKETFFEDEEHAAKPTVLGRYFDNIFPTKPVKVTSLVVGAADTLKTVPAQLRIHIDKEFIKNNLLNLTPSMIENQRVFSSNFKGFKIDLNKSASTGTLGMVFFDFLTTNSKLEVHYKKINEADKSSIDTVIVNFPITNGGLVPVASTIKRNYAGTPIQTQLNNPTVQYPVTYIQGLAGVRTKLSFPYLSKLKEKIGSVILNKAELVVPISSGTELAPFTPLTRLALYRRDIANKPSPIPDQSIFANIYNSPDFGDIAFGGYFNATKKQYVFVVTNYIQSLLDGKLEDHGTYLAATPLSEFEYLVATAATAGRTVIGSGAKDANGNFINPSNRIKLNIFYTKIN